MSPTAKTTLKAVYKISEGRFQISDLKKSLLSDVSYLTSVFIGKFHHKGKTLVALIRLVLM